MVTLKHGNLSSIVEKVLGTPVVEKFPKNFPSQYTFSVWWKEGFLSPVDRKGSRLPVQWKEGFLSPVDRKGSRLPVQWKEGFLSPVDRKSSRFPANNPSL